MKFNQFDKKNLQNLREEMNAVLKKYGADANLEISVGSMRYSLAEVEIKVKAKVIGATTFRDLMLESEVKRLGLVFEKGGRKLIEYNSRRWKRPFVYEEGGKRYIADENYVKYYFSA